MLLGPDPHKFLLNTTPVYLVEGPCNMGETQHEPTVEISKSQEAPKLSECCWGWPITNDLDLGGINIHPMLINNVTYGLDHFHVEGEFFQIYV